MDKFFYQTSIKSSIHDTLKEMCISASNESWLAPTPINIPTLYFDESILLQDEFLSEFMSKVVTKSVLFRLLPNIGYGWHVDRRRQCVINMLINVDIGTSYCLFTDKKPEIESFPIYSINYIPEYYYLLNTKEFHSIYNLDKPRYILSIGIMQDGPIYSDVLEIVKELSEKRSWG